MLTIFSTEIFEAFLQNDIELIQLAFLTVNIRTLHV